MKTTANNVDKQYQDLLIDIIENGNDRGDRTGTGTRSTFGQVLKINMQDGFPLLTSKKMATSQVVNELLWLMSGSTNIKSMVEVGNNIWVGDAYKKYLKWEEQAYADEIDKLSCNGLFTVEVDFQILTRKQFINNIIGNDAFAKLHGELGPIYGKQWRNVEQQTSSHLEAYNKYLLSFDKDYFVGQNCNVHELFENRPYSFEYFYKLITSEEDVIMYHENVQYTFKEVYGNTRRIDQLQDAIDKIITNPEDRRIMVNSWNVSEIHKMTLPPCHYSFQLYVEEITNEELLMLLDSRNLLDEYSYYFADNKSAFYDTVKMNEWFRSHNIPTKKVSLAWNQRSIDTALGLPFNIASYATLLEIICAMTGTISNQLIGFLGDTHLYSNHLEDAKIQSSRPTFELCKIKLPEAFSKSSNLDDVISYENFEQIEFINYQSSEKIAYELSN